jgi:hypothetical protein
VKGKHWENGKNVFYLLTTELSQPLSCIRAIYLKPVHKSKPFIHSNLRIFARL